MSTWSTRYLVLAMCKGTVCPKCTLCATHTLFTKSKPYIITRLQVPVARDLIKQMLHLLCISLILTSTQFYKSLSCQNRSQWSGPMCSISYSGPSELSISSTAIDFLLFAAHAFAEQPHGELCAQCHCCNWRGTKLVCRRGSSSCSGVLVRRSRKLMEIRGWQGAQVHRHWGWTPQRS